MPVSEMIDSCGLRVGGSMPLFLSCDRTSLSSFLLADLISVWKKVHIFVVVFFSLFH